MTGGWSSRTFIRIVSRNKLLEIKERREPKLKELTPDTVGSSPEGSYLLFRIMYIMSKGFWRGLLLRSRYGGDHGPPHGVWRMRNKTLTGPWAGFSFQGGHLITPEGRSIAPSDLQWLSLTCTIAREWSTMMAEGRAKTPPKRPAGVIYLRDQFRKRQEKKAGLQRVDTGPAAKCAGSSSAPARRRKGRV